AHRSKYDDQRYCENVSSVCRLDARTNDEMRAECHLIVNSLSRSRKQTTAACCKFRRHATNISAAYDFDHHPIADHHWPCRWTACDLVQQIEVRDTRHKAGIL